MSDILERLDKLKVKIQDEDFLKGNGLSNEVNIHIFCYEPTDEMPGQRSEEDSSSGCFHDGPGYSTSGTDVSIPAGSL